MPVGRRAALVRIDEARRAARIGQPGDGSLDRTPAGGHVDRGGLPTRTVDRPRDPVDRGRRVVNVTELKFARVKTPEFDDGASTIHSADDRCTPDALWYVVKVSFVLDVSVIVNWNWPAGRWRYCTDAVILSPGETLIVDIVTEPSGYISYHTLYSAPSPDDVLFRADLLDRRRAVAVDPHPHGTIGRAAARNRGHRPTARNGRDRIRLRRIQIRFHRVPRPVGARRRDDSRGNGGLRVGVGGVVPVGVVGTVVLAPTTTFAVPVKLAVVLSVAVTVWGPAVSKVTWKVATPATNVTVDDDRVALPSDVESFAVPV